MTFILLGGQVRALDDSTGFHWPTTPASFQKDALACLHGLASVSHTCFQAIARWVSSDVEKVQQLEEYPVAPTAPATTASSSSTAAAASAATATATAGGGAGGGAGAGATATAAAADDAGSSSSSGKAKGKPECSKSVLDHKPRFLYVGDHVYGDTLASSHFADWDAICVVGKH